MRLEPDAGRSRRHRRAPARRHPLRAARRRHRDHHRAPDRVQPRDPRATRWARRAASGRSSSTSRVTSIPNACASGVVRRRARRSATRSRASCRCTPGSSRCTRAATRCSGAARGCATAGTFPTPDGKAHFVAGRARGERRARGCFLLSTRAREAVQHDGARGDAIRSPARCATRCSWRRRRGDARVRRG